MSLDSVPMATIEHRVDSNFASLTFTTKHPYVCFLVPALMGHPALSLFCIVVRVIFLTCSSGNVTFLIKILQWFTVH